MAEAARHASLPKVSYASGCGLGAYLRILNHTILLSDKPKQGLSVLGSYFLENRTGDSRDSRFVAELPELELDIRAWNQDLESGLELGLSLGLCQLR